MSRSKRSKTPTIGKTGTHEQYQTWFVQSSTRVTTAAWVGNTDGFGDLFHTSFNGRLLSSLRLPIVRDIQLAADQLYPGGGFPAPPAELVRRAPFVPPPTTPAPPPDENPAPAPDRGGGGGGDGPGNGHGGGGGHGNG